MIVPYSLKTISCINIIIWDYESVWPDAWPENKCRSLWPILHGPVILCYILKTVWCKYIILSEYGSVWPNVWPQNQCRSLWPIFHGPVIVPYTLKTISCMNIIIWDYESVWPDASPQNKCRDTMTYISRSNDFMLYPEDYLMYGHHPWGLWVWRYTAK